MLGDTEVNMLWGQWSHDSIVLSFLKAVFDIDLDDVFDIVLKVVKFLLKDLLKFVLKIMSNPT